MKLDELFENKKLSPIAKRNILRHRTLNPHLYPEYVFGNLLGWINNIK